MKLRKFVSNNHETIDEMLQSTASISEFCQGTLCFVCSSIFLATERPRADAAPSSSFGWKKAKG